MKSISMSIIVATLFCSSPVYADTHHLYISGHLSSHSDTEVTVGRQTFFQSELTKIVVHVKENGAIFEKKGYRSDLRQGAPVTVKVSGNEVEEIIVERWKE